MSRLPGRAIKHFGWAMQRHQLWMSEAYLLSREITLLQEEVRRYYYRDIQAIVCTPTRTWIIGNWLAGSLLGFLAACGTLAAVLDSPVAMVLAVITGVVPLIILLGNLILGPTCKTTLYTAAAEAPLHSLGRRRAAERAVTRLLPFIQAAQQMRAPRTADAEQPAATNPPFGTPAGGMVDETAAVRPIDGPDPSDP